MSSDEIVEKRWMRDTFAKYSIIASIVLGTLQALFLVLRLCGIVDMPDWLVFAPVLTPCYIIVGSAGLLGFCCLVAGLTIWVLYMLVETLAELIRTQILSRIRK